VCIYLNESAPALAECQLILKHTAAKIKIKRLEVSHTHSAPHKTTSGSPKEQKQSKQTRDSEPVCAPEFNSSSLHRGLALILFVYIYPCFQLKFTHSRAAQHFIIISSRGVAWIYL